MKDPSKYMDYLRKRVTMCFSTTGDLTGHEIQRRRPHWNTGACNPGQIAEGVVEVKSRTEEKPVMVSVKDGYGPIVEEVEGFCEL